MVKSGKSDKLCWKRTNYGNLEKQAGEMMLNFEPISNSPWWSNSGWINGGIYDEWLKLLVKIIRPSIEQALPRILDNNNSRFGLEVILLTK